jgi:hypothetical protein
MHTVELIEQACALAVELGYEIRQEWLGGIGGGACEFAGKRWIFIDLSLTAVEQLDQVTQALLDDAHITQEVLRPQLNRLVRSRRAA